MRRLLFAFVAAAACPSPGASDPPEVAIFAGGCFWCLEAAFEAEAGVISAEPGYTGGWVENPTEQEVATQFTGHYEAVRVTFDPAIVSYRQLLATYWTNVDPTDDEGQFCDRGPSKRTAVFVANPEQATEAETLRDRAQAQLDKPVVTRILSAVPFWPAEAYHQDFARRNPKRYDFYRRGCGRDVGLERLWSHMPQFAADP